MQQLGPATAFLNPKDAGDFGLNEGERAKLSDQTGELVLQVKLSDAIRPYVALAHKGRWLKEGENQATVTVLNPGVQSNMLENTSVHGVEVKLER